MSLLLSRIQGYLYHLSKFHIYALVYCIGVLDSVGEGKGGMIWENGIETCNIIYETNRQSRFDA